MRQWEPEKCSTGTRIRPADNNNFVIMRYHAMIEIVIFFSGEPNLSVDRDSVGMYALCVAEPRAINIYYIGRHPLRSKKR